MKRVLFSFLIFVLALKPLSADLLKPNVLLDSARIDLAYQRYQDASDLLSRYLKEHPSDIEALYLTMAVDQTKILDYESYLIESPRFLTSADSIRQVLEKRISALRGDDSIACLFYLANVYGGISIMQAKTGSWFDAVKNAVTSVQMLKVVLKRYPNYYPAYLGVGVFDYYLNSSLKWLPFVDDKCKEGLSSMELALKSEFPYDQAAKNTMCWILIERKNFKRADSLASSVLAKYPDNTIFLRVKTLILFWCGEYKRAIKYATRLAEITISRDVLNWSDFIAAYHVLVESYYQLGMKKESLNAADTVLEKNIPQSYLAIPHIKKNYKYIKDLKEKTKF